MSNIGGLFWAYIYPIIASLLYRFIDLLPRSSAPYQWKSDRVRAPATIPTPDDHHKHILFFCPSLGEYESIASIISLLKANTAPPFIEVTFFSSSGYHPLNNDIAHQADHISFCPPDTKKLTQSFFKSRRIDHVIFSSLVLWPVLLDHLYAKDVPYSFVAVSIQQGIWKNLYLLSMSNYITRAEHVITIGDEDLKNLENISNYYNLSCLGDPRVDSIITQTKKAPGDLTIETFINERPGEIKTIIFASTHKEDEDIIIPILKEIIPKGYCIIIAPHHIDRSKEIKQRLESEDILSSNYSSYVTKQDVLIIDKMGLLKHLYQYCDIAYVGGGFKSGLHNVAEPLFSNCYTIVGPNISKSHIAQKLENTCVLTVVKTSESLKEKIKTSRLTKDVIKKSTQSQLSNHIGSSQRICSAVFNYN